MDIWQAQPWQEDGHLHVAMQSGFSPRTPTSIGSFQRRSSRGDTVPATARTSLRLIRRVSIRRRRRPWRGDMPP